VRRKSECRLDVFVPAGETRVAICVFVSRLDELEQVRIQGISGALIQQTQADTVFVIQKRRKARKPRHD